MDQTKVSRMLLNQLSRKKDSYSFTEMMITKHVFSGKLSITITKIANNTGIRPIKFSIESPDVYQITWELDPDFPDRIIPINESREYMTKELKKVMGYGVSWLQDQKNSNRIISILTIR